MNEARNRRRSIVMRAPTMVYSVASARPSAALEAPQFPEERLVSRQQYGPLVHRREKMQIVFAGGLLGGLVGDAVRPKLLAWPFASVAIAFDLSHAVGRQEGRTLRGDRRRIERGGPRSDSIDDSDTLLAVSYCDRESRSSRACGYGTSRLNGR